MIPGKILLAHGSGGRLTHNLIKELLLKKLDNPILAELSDSALLRGLRCERLAFTTDSFVEVPSFSQAATSASLLFAGRLMTW